VHRQIGLHIEFELFFTLRRIVKRVGVRAVEYVLCDEYGMEEDDGWEGLVDAFG
jgi:hypothetical protein